ncbi:crossover junction endonuclease MUS81 [Pectinophora gossypiella]|uniref:crossover junction endonuclease MUS81 n=1 Tax=Pectinophora gossypiella TaxID=13191 RepID=UPI00214F4885|nr:crossover junction endonuclease MUS81 [Pectinophora gossypiella]
MEDCLITNIEGKRVTLKRRRPNPLFEDWLTELYEEAKVKKSKLELKLKEALEAISKYPLPLANGAECAVLKGFDKKLCLFLDRRIEAYNSQQTEPPPDIDSEDVTPLRRKTTRSSTGSTKPSTNIESSHNTSISSENENKSTEQLNTSSDSTGSKNKVSKTRKTYKPAFRSGGYAILITLLEQLRISPDNPSLKKNELIEKAQQHCDESFTRPKPESFYTAWSNMSRMVTKNLVKQSGPRNAEYSLTDEGIALATELLEDSKNIPSINDIVFNGVTASCPVTCNGSVETKLPSKTSSQSSLDSGISVSEPQRTVSDTATVVELTGGSFNIVLLIDKNETSGSKNKNDPTVAQFNKYSDLKHEYRSLKVGDFMWVARHKVKKQELVLPYIVERKRMDDLGSSIKDGRFHEQKFRLRKCGVPNVIYLVENFGSNKHVGLPLQSLMQALANTRVHDGFKIHMTNSLGDSARFLAIMTKRLTIEFQDKQLIGSNSEWKGDEELMKFDYFNKASIKNKPLTVTETFIKLLLQLKGVSVDKALAITKVYKTPRTLIMEYEKCSRKEGEMLLAKMKYGDLNRNVGPIASKAIYMFFVWRE